MINQQKGEESINLRNEFAKEDYTKDKIEIQISTKKMNLSFSNLFKYSAKIQNEIQINEIQQMVNIQISLLQQTTQIQEKNIILFIQLLDDEDVEISINEYSDLYKLSKFFQVNTLEKYLSKFVLNHSNDIEFIIDMINEISNSNSEEMLMNVINSSRLEQCLITKINDCLKSEKFRTLQISQIFRIIQKCSQETIDNNLLYEFIKQNIKERFVLFTFLNIEKLNETNLTEILSNYEKDDSEEKKYYKYLPANLKLIKILKEKEESLNQKMKSLETQMQQINQKNKDFESQLESIKGENEQLKILIKNQKESTETIGNQMKKVNEENEKLKEKIKEMTEKKNEIKIFKEIQYKNDFEGIFNFLRNSFNIKNEVIITCPQKSDNNRESIIFDDKKGLFGVRDQTNQWICFEFINYKVMLTSYTIRSYSGGVYHPKSWIVEGSERFSSWEKIDEQKDCPYMKGRTNSNNNHVHTFNVQNRIQKPFKFIKITQTDANWGSDNDRDFIINCIEFYGSLVDI